MGAYLRSIAGDCKVNGCTRPATVTLFNTFNARQGDYCKTHGTSALRELQASEKRIQT